MIFFCLAVFLLTGWFLPWWALAAVSALIGLAARGQASQVAGSAAVAWMALAYVQDGHSHGIISRRMAGLFGLPHWSFTFLMMALIGGLTALLFFQSGKLIREALKSSGASRAS